MKTCCHCKSVYAHPTKSFNKGKGKDGLRPVCKKCQCEYNKIYWSNHKERIKVSVKEYRIKNKLKIAKRDKEYYARNKDRIKSHFNALNTIGTVEH